MLTSKERGSLRCLLDALEAIRRLYPDFTMARFDVFAHVATHPGASSADVSRALGMPQQTVSRNVALLGNGCGEVVGLGLIKAETAGSDLRTRALRLTNKGRAVGSLIAASLAG